ncbi:CAP domain-containing protein [Halapricum hydrolyticum]|uniref:CAP domain-containing protein n=1 Tax=Halapricum hydrolyticum TaxID=2979991 RepID=A0AAE3LEL0_9EURY|nr:CAP domain-containing protein [Halapricum hydrolyticum]MCU4718376.1 CAP domain-containing protein [Halapricum hydrolyticum]MCU4726511.1 CAP domain-containing protein [Halapricum hydrolyticum]
MIDWRKLWIDTKIYTRKGISIGFRLILVGLIVAGLLLLVGATVGTGIPIIDGPSQDLASGISDFADTSVNRTEVEREIHREINERRGEHGLRPLEWDTELRDIARYHSEDMAQNGYFAHEAPDGETLEDRYQRFNYNCRIETADGIITSGGENIAYTFAGSDVEREDGSVVDHDYDETQIAEGLVSQWMNSPGHRENILRPYWQAEGIGVYIADDNGKTKVYATQNFC